jgi:iron complex outermembrane receptor protein
LAGRVPAGGSAQDNALAAAAIAHLASLGPRAAIPTCASANQNLRERRYDLELQDTLVYSSELRAVSGLGIRRDIDESETFFAGRVGNTSWRAFANVEYIPLSAVSINAGGYFEHDQLSGSSFSPRIAINAHVNEKNTVRFVVSKAARTPNFLEQRATWSYRATQFSPPIGGATEGHFFASATSPGGLQAESILSREIGYFGNFPNFGLMVDAKIFDDRLKHLISEKLQVFDFAPTNDGAARLRGAELQATYSPNPRWFVYGTYAYLLNHASTLLEQTQYFRHSGSLVASLALDQEWRIALTLSGNTANSLGQGGFGREELTLTNTQQWGAGSRLTTSLSVAHLEKPTTDYFIDFGQTAQSRYDNRWQFIGSAKLAF